MDNRWTGYLDALCRCPLFSGISRDEAGMKRLTIMGFSYCVSAFMDNAIAACRGLGKSLVPMIIVISGSCIFRIIWVLTVFAWFKTIPSLYLVYIFSWSITAAFENWYFFRCYRKLPA